MSKKKNEIKLSPLKIIAPIFGLILLFVLVVAIIDCNDKPTVYECTKYEQVVKTTSDDSVDDLLEQTYQYYKISLGKKGKFELEYKTKKTGRVETKTGTYTISGSYYYLTYDNYSEEPNKCTYLLENGKLVRNQFVSLEDKNGSSLFRGTVKQEFKLVK